MTVADINTEEACQIAVAQAMKHLRPDNESEILNAEDTFPQAAREVRVKTNLPVTILGTPPSDRLNSRLSRRSGTR